MFGRLELLDGSKLGGMAKLKLETMDRSFADFNLCYEFFEPYRLEADDIEQGTKFPRHSRCIED